MAFSYILNDLYRYSVACHFRMG